MSKRALQLLFALIVLACGFGVIASRANRPEVTINIAFLGSVNDEDYIGAEAFKTHVEVRSAGRIGVRIYPSGQFCGSERECIEGLQSGVLDVHQTTLGGLATLFPEAQALDLPYLFDSDATAHCVLDGSIREDVNRAILAQGTGLRLMAIGDTGGWRSWATTTRAIRAPADLARLKIRTLPSALEQQLVTGFAASPTSLPWSEVYSALGYGMIDGTKNSVQDMVGMKFQEHIKHVFRDRHAYMAALWWFSEARWQALPEDLKPIVAEGMAVLARATRQAAKDREGPALAAFTAAGGAVYEPTPQERAAFMGVAGGVRDWFISRYGRDWVDRVDAAVAACKAAP